MIHRKFVWRVDEEHGNEGWGLISQPVFNVATTGRLICHDTLEHFKCDGTVEDELQALGAMVFIRGQGYDSNLHRLGVVTNLASDLVRLMETVYGWNGREESLQAQVVGPLLADNEVEGWLQKALQEAVEEFEKYSLDDREVPEDFETTKVQLIEWMRTGYRKAKRRYHGNHAEDLCATFNHLEYMLKDTFLHRQYGDILLVGVCPRQLTTKVRVKSVYEREYADYT